VTTPALHASVLPEVRTVSIGSRGSTAVWDSFSKDGAAKDRVSDRSDHIPTLLLHGWNVDARLNFGSTFPVLLDQRRVVMFDQHGHGAGFRSSDPFDLDTCAADAIGVLDELGIERAIITGYSLGGAIAQIVGRQNPERCAGIVLAATTDRFADHRREQAQFSGLAASARLMRRLSPSLRSAAFRRITALACRRYPPWVLDTVRTADPVALLEAGAALGRFDSTEWNGALTVPSAVVITSRDTVVPPHRQRRLARSLGTADTFELDADHDIPIRDDARLGKVLAAAIDAVEIAHGSP